MLKNYPVTSAPSTKELKQGPSAETMFAILNYSRSISAEKIKNKKVLFNLN